MKRDIDRINQYASCIEVREPGLYEERITAMDILNAYHNLVEIVLHNPKAYFNPDFIAQFEELQGDIEHWTEDITLIIDYSDNKTLLPYLYSSDGQYISPCFIEE